MSENRITVGPLGPRTVSLPTRVSGPFREAASFANRIEA